MPCHKDNAIELLAERDDEAATEVGALRQERCDHHEQHRVPVAGMPEKAQRGIAEIDRTLRELKETT